MPEKHTKLGAPSQHRVPMSELDPNAGPCRSHLHPELGPMLSLREAQARPDIKRRGYLRPELGPMVSLAEAQARPDIKRRGLLPMTATSQKQQVQKTIESAQPVFPVPMPKRKPVPMRKQSSIAAEPSVIKRKPVPSKLSSNQPNLPEAVEKERISPIDSLWERSSLQVRYQRRSYCQVTPPPSPGKVWRWLEVESEGTIEAWPGYKSSPASEASPGKVWRYLEAETDGVIEAWRRNPVSAVIELRGNEESDLRIGLDESRRSKRYQRQYSDRKKIRWQYPTLPFNRGLVCGVQRHY
ncbi:uncharacterized protein MYCFIDRAFT_174820 [Pseudocercospora fijiensis CIRAD86]|uniref:Uncharacterized protein n=1 Tax=Pseudocercospora fijiensis (strain CIRAD86) TaxID=383855 RepID=M3B1X3_PSEFD|nr:uncharacterized protein MYCFIDRAFT_174820 [Pseudocercospora fijiensis CIRAD86]EME83368.1 hypothetical protein MYCFIDRAFT_174820 [Pseudocercospora fijiensis CIRAD86]